MFSKRQKLWFSENEFIKEFIYTRKLKKKYHGMWFQHDVEPAHISANVQNYLNATFGRDGLDVVDQSFGLHNLQIY